jgi:transposase
MVLYTGMQWHMLPIENDAYGKPEIHYTRVFQKFNQWSNDGSLNKVFGQSVIRLGTNNKLDTSILHGDGSSHAAKKGGDNLGYSGHKHFKGEKIVAIVDRNVNIIAPFTTAPGNCHESPLFSDAFEHLKIMAHSANISLKNSVMSLDSAYDSVKNRKIIFNAGMIPNIKENIRNRKGIKQGRKRFYSDAIYQERFQTVERAFAWEDKFKRLLVRFEFKSINHLGMKLLAYTLINLRHFV